MTQPDKDASVLAHIPHLVGEEHHPFGGDALQAHARDADVVKKYIG